MNNIQDWLQALCAAGCVIPFMLAIIVVGLDSFIRAIFPRRKAK